MLPKLLRIPTKIISDNGPEFSSESFNSILDKYGIHHINSTPYKPSSNGLVERANRTIGELLRMKSTDVSSWIDNLPNVVGIYNNTHHTEINCSPAEFLLVNCHNVNPLSVSHSIKETWKEGHPKFLPFTLNQLVLKKRVVTNYNVSNKFLSKYIGPYKVVLVNQNGVTYELMSVVNDNKIVRAHHSQLKAYIRPPDYLIDYLLPDIIEDDNIIEESNCLLDLSDSDIEFNEIKAEPVDFNVEQSYSKDIVWSVGMQDKAVQTCTDLDSNVSHIINQSKPKKKAKHKTVVEVKNSYNLRSKGPVTESCDLRSSGE